MIESLTPITVGADVLEIMSIAMYAEPLAIYRELVQNSADAIDQAIREHILEHDAGRIEVVLDRSNRTATILDNGVGLPNEQFSAQMLGFGASAKRNDTYRGFRGIGRLAGLGHCQQLVFRSRATGDAEIFEARWDGSKVRELLRSETIVPLEQLAHEAMQISHWPAVDGPEHFFEVRLEGLRRLSDDGLLNPNGVEQYLSQVAPVPFSDQFSHGPAIRQELLRRSPLLEVTLLVNGSPVSKPFRDEIEVRSKRLARIREIEFVEVPAVDERTAAVGWIAHHEYLGALKPTYAGRGLRVRSGNLQIGDNSILTRAFPEDRFNAWSIGEFHVFDPRLRPNARRDAFEPSVHVDNLFNQLLPYGTAIARRCRSESKQRTSIKRRASVAKTLDRIEKILVRNRTAVADAIRLLTSEYLTVALDEMREVATVRGTEIDDLDSLARRIAKFAKPRGSGSLSSRDRGRLDVIRWLRDVGQDELLGDAIEKLIKG